MKLTLLSACPISRKALAFFNFAFISLYSIIIFDQKFTIFSKQARSVLYVSLVLVAWLTPSCIVYGTEVITHIVLLRHFITMLQTDMPSCSLDILERILKETQNSKHLI